MRDRTSVMRGIRSGETAAPIFAVRRLPCGRLQLFAPRIEYNTPPQCEIVPLPAQQLRAKPLPPMRRPSRHARSHRR